MSIPAARSCAAILSRSRTRKFSIQTFWASPKYLLVSGKGAKAVGPAACSQTGSPSADGKSEIPRCCWYQSPNAFGSLARKKNPPIPVTFSISVSPATAERTAAPAGSGEVSGGTAVCAAMASWFRPKMKFDPKANDKVRSSWRLRKGIPSSFREGRNHEVTIPAQTGSGKRKDGNRIMFGSDEMVWPDAVSVAIDTIRERIRCHPKKLATAKSHSDTDLTRTDQSARHAC